MDCQRCGSPAHAIIAIATARCTAASSERAQPSDRREQHRDHARAAGSCAGARASMRELGSRDGAAACRASAWCDEPRQLRQRDRPGRRFLAHAPHEAAPADLLRHPALEEGLGGRPQVEVGIELAPEPFDVEQRLLQQHELRLHLDVEAARGLEQPQQHAAERDLLQRPVEDRLAHRADRGFELVDARVRRRPARLDVRDARRGGSRAGRSRGSSARGSACRRSVSVPMMPKSSAM